MVVATSEFGPAPQNMHEWKERMAMFLARRRFLALAALLTLLVAVPQVAAAKGPVPFHATTVETVVLVSCPDPNACNSISVTGSGHATQLGTISESGNWTFDLVNLPPVPNCTFDTGTMTLTGAKGDSISLYLHGMDCLTSPTRDQGSFFYVVTGGTGRFSGATGSGTETIDVDITDFAHPISHPVFDGTLSFPG
jgi:hypothetical protein